MESAAGPRADLSAAPRRSFEMWCGYLFFLLDVLMAGLSPQGSGSHAFIGKRVAAGVAQHVGPLALHWGVSHDLFNACLIHREL